MSSSSGFRHSVSSRSRIAPRRGAALYAGAAVMGLTRPYLGMHYPSDVVVGAALGTALGKLMPGLEDRHRPQGRMPADS